MSYAYRRLEPTEHVVGTDSTLTIPLKDSSGANIDPTGYSASWKLYRGVPRRRRKPFTGTAVLSKSEADGITLATGQASIAVADTDLQYRSGLHWQTLQLTDGSGVVTMLGQGEVMLRGGL